MKLRQGAWLALKVAFSGLLLWFVLKKVDGADIVARVRMADIRWLLPAVLMGPAAVILSAWRWQQLSLGLLELGATVRYAWIGLFFGSILPGVVGGDIAKGVSLAARESRTRDPRLPVSILIDKLVGLWVLLLFFCLVALAMLVVQPALFAGMRGALWAAIVATVAGLVGATVICHPQGSAWCSSIVAQLPGAALRNALGRILAAFASYGNQHKVLFQAAAISAAIHALNACSLWLVMRSLAIPASLWFAAIFYPLLSGLLALPVSISGVGVRDVFAASMFAAFGLDPEAGVAFSWLLLGLSIPSVLVGGAIQLAELFRRPSTD